MKTFEHYRKSEIFAMLLMWMITIGVGIYIAVMYQKIPDVIPTHFGFWGQPDSWGSKTSLLFLYGVSVLMVMIEQWALHAAVKNSVKTGSGSMINRDTIAVTGPFLAGLFGWCSVGTIWLGRLGKYFVFVIFGLVAALFIFILIRQAQERKYAQESGGIRANREREVYRTEKRDDTLGIPDIKFQGKVDLWAWALLIFINVLVIWSVIPAAGGGKEEVVSIITALVVLVLVDLLMVPMYFRNYILLGEQELLIVFGFFKKRIHYRNIELLEETHNPLSSLAMSLDRIYIHTNSGDDVLVAVKEKQAFIEEVYRRAEIWE